MMEIDQQFFGGYTVKEEYEKVGLWKSVTEMWTYSAKAYANELAFVDGKDYSYAEVDADVCALLELDEEDFPLCKAFKSCVF